MHGGTVRLGNVPNRWLLSTTDKDIVNPKLSSWELPRVRYVLWNVYQINNLFNTYYTGDFSSGIAH